MRAINHALTGATIGLIVANPVAALGAALASHFVLDAIPHHGSKPSSQTSRWFAVGLLVDAILCVLLVLFLANNLYAVNNPEWLIVSVCAFVATAPDLLWIPMYIRALRGQPEPTPNRFMRFAKRLQWFERPIGAVVEIMWFIVFTWFVLMLTR